MSTEFPLSHRDLLDAPTGIISTVGPTGIPQTTAVWFLYDENDGAISCWLSDARQKMKNLLARPVCSFFILDTVNTARYLAVRGTVTFTPDNECVFGNVLGKKYGRDDVSFMLVEGETRYKVTIVPTSVSARPSS
jgi:PPOX class probable F420-dependent enzyme